MSVVTTVVPVKVSRIVEVVEQKTTKIAVSSCNGSNNRLTIKPGAHPFGSIHILAQAPSVSGRQPHSCGVYISVDDALALSADLLDLAAQEGTL